MSSLTLEKGARIGYRLRVYTAAGRRSIWLGHVSKSEAVAIQRHVDEILAAQTADLPIPRPTSQWLRQIPADLRAKLRSITGASRTVSEAVDEYLDARNADLAQSTIATLSASLSKLTAAIGKSLIANVTPAELSWIYSSLAVSGSTAGKHAKHFRQFFTWAIGRHYLAENPAAGLSTRVDVRPKTFVTAETIKQVLDVVTCPELRAAILLCRWGGLRIPSEIATLSPSDFDTKTKRITINDVKRSRTRLIPLFPELRELANGADLFPTFRTLSPATLSSRFRSAILSSGLQPWPALWHSMRATRETELIESHGLKAACEWIGNSEAVAIKSYSLIPEKTWTDASG
jgi:integrase